MLHTRFTPPATNAARPQLPVWKMLFDRQTALLHRRATPAFGVGVAALGLSREAPPDLAVLEQKLQRHTGWRLHPEAAPLECQDYFAALGSRHLPVVTGLRGAADFDQLPTPDLFADVFGRLPLLLTPEYAELLAELGRWLGQLAPGQRPALRRFYHATADFGTFTDLTAEGGAARLPQVFGARLLTSAGHLHAALAAPAPPTARNWAHLHELLAVHRAAAPETAGLAAGSLGLAGWRGGRELTLHYH
ncbi:hypothetical protein [uncultured Hymenobacter sp.]|uniref:hypothetical protein n=1 Tax=uncultured Hymenobacter sp. TaxID=170016 RepID=UPI0035CB2530